MADWDIARSFVMTDSLGSGPAGHKRSHDDLEYNGTAEPASKRPLLAMAPDGVIPQDDVEMTDTNADSSVPNNANVSEPTSKHAVQSPVRAEDIFDRTKLYFAWKILDDFAQRFLDDRPGASYVYRMPSSGPQEPVSFSTIDGKDIPRMMLRPGLTFFHINEVTISKKAFQNGRTTFGLFARVVRAGCGSDEYWPKDFQCFQLEDLFGGQPYLSGITFFEETESPLRRQPSLFVQAGENEDKCFCLCQYVNEECHVPGTRLGWGVYIHEILPVTWETIRIVHTQVGGPRRRPWEPTYRY